jgi:threonylcarbamoyladenosine tRNA methylthiotransferase CDKAL1
MNREYKIEEFEHVCDFLKERVPDITIATDIICGFPEGKKSQQVLILRN